MQVERGKDGTQLIDRVWGCVKWAGGRGGGLNCLRSWQHHTCRWGGGKGGFNKGVKRGKGPDWLVLTVWSA